MHFCFQGKFDQKDGVRDNTQCLEIFLPMIDPHLLEEHPEKVREAIRLKGASVPFDELRALFEERRKLLQEVEAKRKEKNTLAKQLGGVSEEERASLLQRASAVKQELAQQEQRLQEVQRRFHELLLQVPNIPLDDVPHGKDEEENVVLRQWGEKPSFSFQPREHWEIAEKLGMLDMERAAKIAGSRFFYLKGDLVRLWWGMLQMAMDVLTDREYLRAVIQERGLSVPDTPFLPVLPPVMMRPEVMRRMARLDPEEMYQLERDNLVLIGSAEHSLGSLYMDEILEEDMLPLRLVGFSVAFRREAGSHGKDMKGMLRVHQFEKMEMESFTLPEQGREEQELLVALQERLMQELELPYQVVAVCTGDMGFPDARQIDIEVWMPGQGTYRETHSADYIGDFQARRLQTRMRRSDGKKVLVHMNDATVFSQRPLIAILENFQQEDGTVRLPKALQERTGLTLLKPLSRN